MFFKIRSAVRSPEDDEGSSGGGGDGGLAPEVKAMIDKAVADATTGLKKTNAELKAEKREIAERLKAFDGIDPEAVGTMLKRFADDEEAGLIKAGKIDEVLNKRTERMKSGFEKELTSERKAREAAEARSAKYTKRVLENAIRAEAAAAGLHKHAIDDALFRASTLFSTDEDGNPVAAQDVYGKDGKPLTVKEWFSDMREKAPHWWPATNGGGASNGGGGSGNAPAGNWTGSSAERQAAIRKKFPNLPN